MLLEFLTGEKKRAPAECVIKLDGSEITDLYPSLVEVTVTANRTEPTMATMVFETRRIEDGTWTVQDDDRFKPWADVKIEAVFGDETEEVMSGYVQEVKADYPAENGSAKVTMTCLDQSMLLDREHVNVTWGSDSPTTDAQIVQQIVGRHGMSVLEEPGSGQSNLTANQNTTDYRFLRERAEANGYELLFQEGKMYFGPMRLDAMTQDTILVYAGPDTNCISFNLQDDGNNPDKVVFEVAASTGSGSVVRELTSNLRLLGKQPADSTSSGLGDFVWRPTRTGVSDETQMEAIAQRMANEQSMKIKVTGELDGSLYGHVLRVGEPVGVDGVGERYGGTYYVDTATHRFDVNGYSVSFQLLRNAYGDDLGEGSGNPLAGIL